MLFLHEQRKQRWRVEAERARVSVGKLAEQIAVTAAQTQADGAQSPEDVRVGNFNDAAHAFIRLIACAVNENPRLAFVHINVNVALYFTGRALFAEPFTVNVQAAESANPLKTFLAALHLIMAEHPA